MWDPFQWSLLNKLHSTDSKAKRWITYKHRNKQQQQKKSHMPGWIYSMRNFKEKFVLSRATHRVKKKWSVEQKNRINARSFPFGWLVVTYVWHKRMHYIFLYLAVDLYVIWYCMSFYGKTLFFVLAPQFNAFYFADS